MSYVSPYDLIFFPLEFMEKNNKNQPIKYNYYSENTVDLSMV